MSGPNLFERAKSIRMNGENWQNAIQRAKAQLNYEIQLGGENSYSDSSLGGGRKKKARQKGQQAQAPRTSPGNARRSCADTFSHVTGG